MFGLGYVGVVTGACLANEGHVVIGVDINPDKVSAINKGKSPVIEKGLNEAVSSSVRMKRFFATMSAKTAILNSDMAMICVGTPSQETGASNIEHVKKVSIEIASALKDRSKYFTVVIRSTVLPGTTEGIIIPLLEKHSDKKAGRDFGVCVNPEFMREGNSLMDFYSPSKIVIGIRTEKEKNILLRLFSFIKEPVIITDIRTAEMCKYLDNIFHAIKICFANEAGVLSRKMAVDPHRVMEIFCSDKISNISERYLKPGFAFGGSCLAKDIRAILYKAKSEGIDVPLVASLLKSNETHIQRAFQQIKMTGKHKLALLGLSFKPGTDDLRDSPMVKLAELLIDAGFKLKIYDKNVSLAVLTGVNKAYIQKEIPKLASLLVNSLDGLIKKSEVIILGHDTSEFKDIAKKLRKSQVLVDLIRADRGR